MSREAARTVASGTMRGIYGGIVGEGRRFATDQAVFARVRDGKISEIWEIVDVSSIKDQLPRASGAPAGDRFRPARR